MSFSKILNNLKYLNEILYADKMVTGPLFENPLFLVPLFGALIYGLRSMLGLG